MLSKHLIGILRGEGVGPSLLDASLLILDRVGALSGCKFEVRFGGEIGCESARRGLGYLPGDVVEFARSIFADGGALLAGAGGGRFVYEMRHEFALFHKLNPIHSYPELAGACRLKSPPEPVDILVVRENLHGLYQGEAEESLTDDGREIRHTFRQAEKQVRNVLEVAASAASGRRKKLTVVCKDAGLPVLHSLWRDCAEEVAAGRNLTLEFLDIDYAVYKLVQEPWKFDVVAAPNCFGDILADLGGVIAGARGLTYGGSFSKTGAAVYQTNHGAAYDLTGTDVANPVGQILSLAMLLRMSFGLQRESNAIEQAVQTAWRDGWRTADLPEAGTRCVGTAEFAARVVERLAAP
ncbi:MAG: isocitrate/isopropylmalate family dehydrogenase [Chthoniobacterales bacterium]